MTDAKCPIGLRSLGLLTLIVLYRLHLTAHWVSASIETSGVADEFSGDIHDSRHLRPIRDLGESTTFSPEAGSRHHVIRRIKPVSDRPYLTRFVEKIFSTPVESNETHKPLEAEFDNKLNSTITTKHTVKSKKAKSPKIHKIKILRPKSHHLKPTRRPNPHRPVSSTSTRTPTTSEPFSTNSSKPETTIHPHDLVSTTLNPKTTQAPLESTQGPTSKSPSAVSTSSPSTKIPVIIGVIEIVKQNDTHTIVQNSSKIPIPDEIPEKVWGNSTVHFDARDITYFLESHEAHSVHDPRAYFTEERSSRSLSILLDDLRNIPEKLRFAFMVRVFNELGRKVATKLNKYSQEVVSILKKNPDGLGNKPGVSMLADVVNAAFESKQDLDTLELFNDNYVVDNQITGLIRNNTEKTALFEASIVDISNKFARLISYFAYDSIKNAIEIPDDKLDAVTVLLSDAMHDGAKRAIKELNYNDKYYIPSELVRILFRILNLTSVKFRALKDDIKFKDGSMAKSYHPAQVKMNFKDLNKISDRTGFLGPWNSHIFTNLGSAERVVKLFASMISRVPDIAKSRWVNMHWAQVSNELDRTMNAFVAMQTLPGSNSSSDKYLLAGNKSASSISNQFKRDDYLINKNRVPARCYLAGRRWRLMIGRSLKGSSISDDVIKKFSDRISSLKQETLGIKGNEISRLCIPRLEVGLRGWDISGDPHPIDRSKNFALKNPIENLHSMDDPFTSGIKLGYNLGFKVGYNEKRNATLEMEKLNSAKGSKLTKAKSEIRYLAAASYRHGATAGARKAFDLAIREGYLATLKLTIRSGMRIPVETGSHLASLRSTSFGGQAGLEAGRNVVDKYLADKEPEESARKNYIKVGETYGVLGGQIMGETIGSIVGKEAAEEAYKRSIIRGGKVSKAKFHLDEYESGAKLGFEHGIKTGELVATSSTIDPSAPNFFRIPKPAFYKKGTSREVDHWEKELMPVLTDEVIESMHMAKNHTIVMGTLKGFYRMTEELKRGLNREAYKNSTHELEVKARGFVSGHITYLSMTGLVDNVPFLKGSLVARDVLNDT